MAKSRALCSRSFRLVAASRRARVSAERTRVECVTVRGAADTPLTGEDVQHFVVEGLIDGRPATARFVDGQLCCTAEVVRRVEVVVAIRDLRPRWWVGAAVLVVLHVPATGISVLGDILDRASSLPVLRAGDGMALERGLVLVAPTGHHLLVDGSLVRFSRGPLDPQEPPLRRGGGRP